MVGPLRHGHRRAGPGRSTRRRAPARRRSRCASSIEQAGTDALVAMRRVVGGLPRRRSHHVDGHLGRRRPTGGRRRRPGRAGAGDDGGRRSSCCAHPRPLGAPHRRRVVDQRPAPADATSAEPTSPWFVRRRPGGHRAQRRPPGDPLHARHVRHRRHPRAAASLGGSLLPARRRTAVGSCTQSCRSAPAVTIRVVIADDQEMVRAGSRVISNRQRRRHGGDGEAPDGLAADRPLPGPASRHLPHGCRQPPTWTASRRRAAWPGPTSPIRSAWWSSPRSISTSTCTLRCATERPGLRGRRTDVAARGGSKQHTEATCWCRHQSRSACWPTSPRRRQCPSRTTRRCR